MIGLACFAKQKAKKVFIGDKILRNEDNINYNGRTISRFKNKPQWTQSQYR